MRLIGRRLSQRSVVAGNDEVVAGYPIPSNGSLNSIHLGQHIISSEGQDYRGMGIYGCSGFVLPVLDPDGGATFQAIWDAQVPKDVDIAAGAFDLDTGAADTTPEFEIGTPDVSAIVDMAAGAPREIFRRRKYMTVASQKAIYTPVDAGTDLVIFTDHYVTTINQGVRAVEPSVVLIGFSSPDTARTDQVEKTIPNEAEWALLQYLEVALENMLMSLIGLTEAGAESPYEESLAFIAELVEDTVFEETANLFITNTYTVYTRATFDITVPGRISVKTVSSE